MHDVTYTGTFLAASGVQGTLYARTVPEAVVIGMTLGVIILATIVGNLFVIFAIVLEKDLRRPQYYLILSLAVADLLVGCIVAPVYAVYELQKRWTLGVLVCQFWSSTDVLVCTSSILHLVAIALDRYWSVTSVYYSRQRTTWRIVFMLAIVWTLSLVLSLLPIFLKDEAFEDRILEEKICLVSQNVGYQLFAVSTAFYVPLAVIIFIYWRVFQEVKHRCKRQAERKAPSMPGDPRKSLSAAVDVQVTRSLNPLTNNARSPCVSDMADGSTTSRTPLTSNGVRQHGNNEETSLTDSAGDSTLPRPSIVPDCNTTVNAANDAQAINQKRRRRRRGQEERAEAKRERKATRTLAIITGTFVLCWLPFFTLALVRPLFEPEVPRPIEGFLSWLGYLNSAINPIIYTIFSPDFRMAFQKMLKRLIMWQ